MKKLLFTLATLLMASVALALPSQLGAEREDPLPAIVPQISFNVVADGVRDQLRGYRQWC